MDKKMTTQTRPRPLEQLTHGGDWAGFEIEYGRAPLDYSANVNPLGIPAEVQAAIAEAAASSDRYPDPLCRELTQKLAEHEKVPPEWIFFGNGAADIIFRLAAALRPAETGAGAQAEAAACMKAPKLLVTAPTFSEYETAFAAGGWQVDRYLLQENNGFRIGEDILDWIGDSETGNGAAPPDAVFLCEPNNPTGVTTDRQLLQKICQECRRAGITLVIDECFNGFLEDPEQHSMKGELGEGNLILLKAFTKLYGMAGVRLGYCLCADGEIIGRLRQAGPPWNVSNLAQAAGMAALDARDHVARGIAIVREERAWLRDQLAAAGITEVCGEANYLFFQAAPDLDLKMRQRGILIRSCSNYPGLGEGWFRIAVRTHEENEQLMQAIREIYKTSEEVR